MELNTIFQGDCKEVLKTLPEESIDCVVTSPPYYGLRDYGVDGQIGLEESPEEYVERLVEVFREVKRVLKKDGTLWVNIGDSYVSKPKSNYGGKGKSLNDKSYGTGDTTLGYKESADKFKNLLKTYKNKDLIGVPWVLAFALRNDGWYLRQDIIWSKPNPMPESVKDRCTKSHEYIFLLSKSPKYYFDSEAIKEDCVSKDTHKSHLYNLEIGAKERNRKFVKSKYIDSTQESSVRQGMNKDRGNKIIEVRKNLPTQKEFVDFIRSKTDVNTLANSTSIKKTTIEHWFRTDDIGFSFPSVDDWKVVKEFIDDWGEDFKRIDEMLTDVTYETDSVDKNYDGKRNKRDVWNVPVKSCKESHFATYPEELIKPCILAGCREKGIVLDPFFGSGTTGRVALSLGRNYLGIELNPEYIEIAKRRTKDVQSTLF